MAANIGIQRPGADQEAVPPLVGQAFCFLPLPVQTGLPVHVNGTFELSSNRRDIWHGSSMSGDGAARANWNLTLLQVGLHLLLFARRKHLYERFCFALWEARCDGVAPGQTVGI